MYSWILIILNELFIGPIDVINVNALLFVYICTEIV